METYTNIIKAIQLLREIKRLLKNDSSFNRTIRSLEVQLQKKI